MVKLVTYYMGGMNRLDSLNSFCTVGKAAGNEEWNEMGHMHTVVFVIIDE